MKTRDIKLPELVGTLAALEPHVQEVVKAYGAACVRVAIRAAWRAAQPAQGAWQPIETAPKDRSLLLCVAGSSFIPIYCGRYRKGDIGEPQPSLVAWRCDSSGRFADPTHWQPLPEPPKGEKQ